MGNKNNLKDSQEIDDDEASSFAEDLKGEFIKISAKTFEKIKELFNIVATKLLSQKKDDNKTEKKCKCGDYF